MFWFLIGIIVAIGGMALFGWLRRNSLKPKWYSWGLLALGLVTFLVTLEASLGSFAENEATAGSRLMLVGVVFLAVTWLAAWRLITAKTASKGLGA